MKADDWNISNTQLKQERIVKFFRISISWLLALTGFGLLVSQLFPLATSFAYGKIIEIKSDILAAPLPNAYKQYIQGEFAYYDPGVSYFQNLMREAGKYTTQNNYTFDPTTKSMKQVVINPDYTQPMYLSIADIDINRVKVTPNVESYDEDVYNLYLKEGLAHFKGTPLPGDGGNSFIYGHSAVSSFFTRHESLAETIFTRLEDIDVGKKVAIIKDGSELMYTVRNKKIVEADDFSIFQQNGTKETVTLMTCWPNGVGTKRLIVIADRDE